MTGGRVPELPMFPLGTVLLPHMVLPLHIFEPRYRTLIRDVLDGDREFGVTLITRGHEVGGGDERADVGTVARVLQAEELDDGRWLVVSVGVRRVRIRTWLEDRPYPHAVVEDLVDEELRVDLPAAATPETGGVALDPATESRLRRVLAMYAELGYEGVPATLDVDPDPTVASWQVAVAAPLTPFDAQRVLATDSCRERLALLDELLRDLEEVLGLQLRSEEDPED
jgi:uncharacterized protein